MAKKTASRVVATSDAQPYSSRFDWDWDGGMAIPRQPEGGQAGMMSQVRFEQDGNKISAFVPTLASGAMSRPMIGGMLWEGMGGTEWSFDHFANWEPWEFHHGGLLHIRKAKRYWRDDPLVYRCVKVLAQLANSKFSIDCENEEVKTMVEMWVAASMPHTFRKQFFVEYFKTSMVPIIKALIPYVPRDYKEGKIPQTKQGNVESNPLGRQLATTTILERNDANLKALEKVVAERNSYIALHENETDSPELTALHEKVFAAQHVWSQGNIPGAYTILDPESIIIKGPRDIAWLREPYLKVDGTLMQAIKNPTPQQKAMLKFMPSEIVQQAKDGTFEIWLAPNIFKVVSGDKQDYELYPTPIVSHAFEALEIKHDMMAMDRATVSSVRNRILKVTIGNDTFPEFDKSKIQELARIFASPTRNLTLFWNHTLKLEWIEPGLESFKDVHKYDPWNDEIRTAFGISRIMTGTTDTAGAIGNTVMNFKGVEEEVSEAQASYLEWFHDELKMFKAALGLSDEIAGSFDCMNLKDEVKFRAVLTQMVQNGLLDEQTALETMDYHFPTVQARMEKMAKLHKKGLFCPRPSSNNLGPGGGTPSGGKPANAPLADNNQNKKGVSQPKKAAAAKVINDGQDGLYLVIDADEISPDARQEVCDTFNVPVESVLTRAEYQTQFGSAPDLGPSLPELTQAESFAAMRQGLSFSANFAQKYEEALANFKQQGGGKRGKYVTAAKKAELQSAIKLQLTKQIASSYLEPEDYDEMIDEQKAELELNFELAYEAFKESLADKGQSEEEALQADLFAAASIAMRIAKARKVAAIAA